MTQEHQRIVVIGSSCAGKTTLASKLSKKLKLPHTQLDEIHWLPDWVERDKQDFVTRVEALAKEPAWVTDGNYMVARPVLWPRATTIIWLDYSFPRVLWQSIKRSFRRAYTREKLFAGNQESFRRTFLSKESIILWVIQTHKQKRKKYPALLKSDLAKGAQIHVFKTPQQTHQFLRELV